MKKFGYDLDVWDAAKERGATYPHRRHGAVLDRGVEDCDRLLESATRHEGQHHRQLRSRPSRLRSETAAMSYRGFSETYRSGRTRYRVAIALLAVTGVILLLSALHDLRGFDLIRDAEAGTLSDSDVTRYDEATQIYASLYVIAFIATAVAYLAWLSRTVDNVPKLTAELPEVTPRWSIGWWFVPIANLFKPYQIVKNVNSLLSTEVASTGNALIIAWWVAWLVAGVGGAILFRLPEPATLEELNTWFTANLAVDLTSVVAAVLAILVVRQIQSRADSRAAGVVGASMPGSASVDRGTQTLPPCPRCGSAREAGVQFCGTCGLDFWAAYDDAERRGSR